MILWDLLSSAQFSQKFSVWVTNIYDQNLFVGKGTRAELMAQEYEETYGKDEFKVFDHLQHTIDRYSIKDNMLIIYVRDANYTEPLAKQYSTGYVAKWNMQNKESRPFRTTWEIENGEA